MEKQKKKRRAIDIANDRTEWGISLTDSKTQFSLARTVVLALSYLLVFAASLIAIPLLVGLSLSSDAVSILHYMQIIIPLVVVACVLQYFSRRGPRNAMQVDYAACEVRLGTMKPDGTFVRHRVCPLSKIDKVYIERPKGKPAAVCLRMGDEVARITFADADNQSLTLLAAQISAARETAEKMPLTTRITSKFLGLEASAREMGQRVRSRVVTRPV